MDSQELNRACELAFLVAREGVEQDPPVDPPAPMRMFLYVRQYPQRALTVARQVLCEDEEFRSRVADAASEENVGAHALQWLRQEGQLDPESPLVIPTGDVSPDSEEASRVTAPVAATAAVAGAAGVAGVAGAALGSSGEEPVTKESIRSELDELKSLVGQISDEREAAHSELTGLPGRLEESEHAAGLDDVDGIGSAVGGHETDVPVAASSSAPVVGTAAVASDIQSGSATSSLSSQVRSLHADLRQARSERDMAQEAKELAILEQAELAEELEQLRGLAGQAQVQLGELEARVDEVSIEKDQLAAERTALSSDRDSLSAEVTEAEAKLATATAELDRLNAEVESARTDAGSTVAELQAAVSARAAMESHVDALGGAHVKAQAEMERVQRALADKSTSDTQKIETLKVALASVTAERDALQTKLEAVRETVSSLQSEMAKLDINVTDAESEASVLGERMAELQSSVDVLPAEESVSVDMAQLSAPAALDLPAAAPTFIPGNRETDRIEEPVDIDEVAGEVSETVATFDSDLDETQVFEAPDLHEQQSPVAPDSAVSDPSTETITSESLTEHAVETELQPEAVTPTEVPETAADAAGAVPTAAALGLVGAAGIGASIDDSEVPETPDVEVTDVDAADVADVAVPDASESTDAGTADELIPDELLAEEPLDETVESLGADASGIAEADVSPLVMSDVSEDYTAGMLDEPVDESAGPDVTVDEATEPEDIDEVHELVAETVASFEPSETDQLPGSEVPPSDVPDSDTAGERGGLKSLFSSASTESEIPEAEVAEDSGSANGFGVAAGLGAAGIAGAAARLMGRGDVESEELVTEAPAESEVAEIATDAPANPFQSEADVADGVVPARSPIATPADVANDPLGQARFYVNTENAVLLVDGDPVAAMGWPSVDRVEQRRNLVHYLSVMAGNSGAAPDVLLDRDYGSDRLPDSRSVRVRITNEEGSVSAQIVSLIDTYPADWPVVVVTDNADLQAEAAMKGATLLENGQLLDLFIAP